MNARYEDYAEEMGLLLNLLVFFSTILEIKEGLEQLEIN